MTSTGSETPIRKLIASLFVLACLPIAGPGRASTAMPYPDSFDQVVTSTTGAERVQIRFDSSPTSWASMLVIEHAHEDGRGGLTWYELSYRDDEWSVEVKTEDGKTTVVSRPDQQDRRFFSIEIGPGDGDVLRVGIASWGGHDTFQLLVDGVPIEAEPASPSRVTVKNLMEFDGGYAAIAGSTSAGAKTSYSVAGSGHMVGYFLPGYSVRRGTIQSPNGLRGAGDGHITESGHGEWKFTISAGANLWDGDGPALWLMDFPE